MGLKLNLFLSIGALLPFFFTSLFVSVLIRTNFLLNAIFIILLVCSIVINIYFVKFIEEKQKFNPRQFKITSVEKENGSSLWFSILTISFMVFSLISILPLIMSQYRPYFFLLVSLSTILYFTFFLKEELIYMLISVRLKYHNLYSVQTSDYSKISIISREKLQSNIEFKAYFVVDDFFLFGYRIG